MVGIATAVQLFVYLKKNLNFHSISRVCRFKKTFIYVPKLHPEDEYSLSSGQIKIFAPVKYFHKYIP